MCKIFADCSGFCTFFRNICTLFQMKISSAPDGPMEKRKHKRADSAPFVLIPHFLCGHAHHFFVNGVLFQLIPV
ncbi:hypothetical protein GHH_c21640 [Geobacillus sp. GHH01]|nr:hypothetical protein GHH_c21640 [Geobacillus sp. GHH01]